MKKVSLVVMGLALLCSVRAKAQEQKFKLEDFAWLAGCWESNRAGRIGEERWTTPKGGMMLGTGQTMRMARRPSSSLCGFTKRRATSSSPLNHQGSPKHLSN